MCRKPHLPWTHTTWKYSTGHLGATPQPRQSLSRERRTKRSSSCQVGRRGVTLLLESPSIPRAHPRPGETLIVSDDGTKRAFTHRELHTKVIGECASSVNPAIPAKPRPPPLAPSAEKDAKIVLWAADPDVEPKAASLPLRGPKTLRQVLQSIDQTLVPVLRGDSRAGGVGGVSVDGSSPPGPFRTDIRARMASVASSLSDGADGGASGCGGAGGGGRRGVIIGISELPGRRLEYVLEVEEAEDSDSAGDGGGAASASAAPVPAPVVAAVAPAGAAGSSRRTGGKGGTAR